MATKIRSLKYYALLQMKKSSVRVVRCTKYPITWMIHDTDDGEFTTTSWIAIYDDDLDNPYGPSAESFCNAIKGPGSYTGRAVKPLAFDKDLLLEIERRSIESRIRFLGYRGEKIAIYDEEANEKKIIDRANSFANLLIFLGRAEKKSLYKRTRGNKLVLETDDRAGCIWRRLKYNFACKTTYWNRTQKTTPEMAMLRRMKIKMIFCRCTIRKSTEQKRDRLKKKLKRQLFESMDILCGTYLKHTKDAFRISWSEDNSMLTVKIFRQIEDASAYTFIHEVNQTHVKSYECVDDGIIIHLRESNFARIEEI